MTSNEGLPKSVNDEISLETIQNKDASIATITKQSSTTSTTVTTENNVLQKTVPRKHKLSSEVWNHMKDVIIGGVKYAICDYCKGKIKAVSSNGTSSLRNHLARCPGRNTQDIGVALKHQKQIVEEKLLDVKSVNKNFNFNQERSLKELACAIILHEYPLSIVEHRGLQRFVASLQPYFKMVSRNTIKGEIFKVYEYERTYLKDILQHIKSRVTITTDMWTSNQRKGYISITAHFVDDDWKLQSRILRFMYVPTPHTMDVLAEHLLEGVVSWHLETKFSTITVDNCSTNDGMINLILDKLSPHCLLDGRFLHMRCCAHILNLIVKDGCSVIENSITNIRDSVSYWAATPSRVENFFDVVRSLKISCNKKLVLDCKTRWNSTFLMLQRAIEYKEVFPRLKFGEKNYSCLPTEEDWYMASLICEKLKLFFNATELFSITRHPTSHLYFIKICEIKETLDKWVVDSHDETLKQMVEKMREKFAKYWSDVHIIMSVSIILDPRYKMKAVQFFFQSFYGEYAHMEIERVKQTCYDLLNEYQSKGTYDLTVPSTTSTLESPIFEEEYYSSHAKLVEMLKVESCNGIVKSELDYYLDEKVLPYTQEFDILAWWKTHGVKYPTLQIIARDILATPVSTVASESVFSAGGRVVNPHRSRLHKDTLEALMCTQSWLRNKIEEPIISGISISTIESDVDEEEY